MNEQKKKFNAPEKPEGYESIITPQVYEAVKNVTFAMDNLIRVYQSFLKDRLGKSDGSPYAMIQFIYMDDNMKIAMESINNLYNIHNMSKEVIDKQCKDLKTSVEEVKKMLMMKSMMDALKEILK